MASPTHPAPPLPEARGPISDAVLTALIRQPGPIEQPNVSVDDVLADDDLQLALYCCYELHYRSFRGVDPYWEWNPGLIAARERLEYLFEDSLRESLPAETVAPREVEATLRELVAEDDGPPLARTLERHAGIEQFREFVVHRSAYRSARRKPIHTPGRFRACPAAPRRRWWRYRRMSMGEGVPVACMPRCLPMRCASSAR